MPTPRLILELAGAAVMGGPENLEVLARLRGWGARVSVDDFGVRGSSLALLGDLPADELKIDRALVRALSGSRRAASVAKAVFDLGHELGLCVTAVGVEDAGTLATLADLGCDQAQGFFLCRPVPGPDFLRRAVDIGNDWRRFAVPATARPGSKGADLLGGATQNRTEDLSIISAAL